ncbi:MAG: response regulator, partial [Deltaproteobacteria bacterium]|nr:response regulator [Deltaproteobacteria bacterium]
IVPPSSGSCPVRRSIDSTVPAEFELTTPEGKVLVWQSYPMAGGMGADPRSAVVYIQDVTEKRLLTQKLIQSDKLSSLGELVSGVAHELNNPLTGIMCFSELLLEERLGESAESKLRKINEASHRCKKIIENLLTFARWKRPEKRYDDVNRIIKDSVEFRAYQLSMDNIEIKLDLSGSVPGTMVDASQMQQVFLNLINNARDAIREKGPGGRIEISSRLSAGKIVVSVTDTGKGFSEEVANRLFDPFFTTKDVGKGTGLGLSISYGIIHEHGGNIYASSRLRIGTTFVVELPVVDEEFCFDVSCGTPRQERVSVDGMRALILDDEDIVLDLLADSLAGFGFEVDKCSSAEDALKRISDSCYNLIISDMKMPGLGGKGFYREVEKIDPGVLKKIIFISGDSMGAETQEFLEAVGNPSLKKPFSIDELSEVVSKMVL